MLGTALGHGGFQGTDHILLKVGHGGVGLFYVLFLMYIMQILLYVYKTLCDK